MTLKQICSVKDNRLIINLPHSFKEGRRVLVIVDDGPNVRDDKMTLMQKAALDPLYLADMAEIEEDFDFADSEEKMNADKWEILRADLDPVVGSEQGKTRPVLVISENDINNLLNIVNVLPITTRKPDRVIYPNEALLGAGKYGLPNESIVLCHQIRTIDKKRLSSKYGIIQDTDKQDEIIEALRFQLGI